MSEPRPAAQEIKVEQSSHLPLKRQRKKANSDFPNCKPTGEFTFISGIKTSDSDLLLTAKMRKHKEAEEGKDSS